MKNRSNTGIGMVELLVAIAIIIIIISTLVFAFNLLLRFGLSSVERIQATYLAEEGIEAVRHIRDENYLDLSSLTKDTDYYLVYVNDHWATTTTNTYVDGLFERAVVFSEVKRDASDDIADTGTTDSDTLLVTVNVSWRNHESTTTKSVSTYITNLFQDE